MERISFLEKQGAGRWHFCLMWNTSMKKITDCIKNGKYFILVETMGLKMAHGNGNGPI